MACAASAAYGHALASQEAVYLSRLAVYLFRLAGIIVTFTVSTKI